MKSEKTYELEEIITLATSRANRIGCPEVTLDDNGIVDFICMDLDGEKIVRCYELKITKSDFLSDAKKTFIGEFNYYVIPSELWMSVKNYVEPWVGVWLVSPQGRPYVKKKAVRRPCQMDKKRIMGKILRALNRENLKHATGKWRERRLAAKVGDISGRSLLPGDIVDYRQERYRIVSIDYSSSNLEMQHICVLEPVDGGNNLVEARPGILKKVSLGDIISSDDGEDS